MVRSVYGGEFLSSQRGARRDNESDSEVEDDVSRTSIRCGKINEIFHEDDAIVSFDLVNGESASPTLVVASAHGLKQFELGSKPPAPFANRLLLLLFYFCLIY